MPDNIRALGLTRVCITVIDLQRFLASKRDPPATAASWTNTEIGSRLFIAQRLNRIDSSSAQGRNVAG
jgi:hypothetical protein